MALEDLAAALRREAEEECRALVAEARRQAETIGERSDGEKSGLIERETRDLTRALTAEGMTLVYQALLDVEGERERIALAFVDRAREACLSRLGSLREDPGYASLFAALVSRAMAGMPPGATLRIDPRDELLARSLLPGEPPPAIVADTTTLGGVVAVTPDGLITVDATVESCLERYCREAAPDLVRLLEGEGR